MKKIIREKEKDPKPKSIVLPYDGRYWCCHSHRVVFEPGDTVLQKEDDESVLFCPLNGCQKYQLSFSSKEYYDTTYEFDEPLK